MADSIREQIIAAAFSLIDAATTTTVYRSRVAALSSGQLPAIVVSPIRDTPGDREGALCWTDWELTLAVDVVVAADPPELAADQLTQLAHAALMAEPRTLGIGAVTDINPTDVEFMQEPSGTVTGVTRSTYSVSYRTKQADLTVAP